jgi:hypothetical protein
LPKISPGGSLVPAALLVLALTACSPDDDTDSEPPGPHTSPAGAGYCNDLPHAGGDGGLVLGTDWSGETHPYDEAVDLTVCVTTAGGGRVRVTSSDTGVAVTPRSQQVPDTGDGLLTVQVRVDPGTVAGPTVVTTDDGWHLERS